MEYTCGVCRMKVPRDLLVFKDHTEAHIADEIKKNHPEWVEADGVCRKCLAHFKKAMKGE